MKITTAEEMRTIDRVTTERFGVPSLTLMENAGTGVADFVLRRYPRAETIGIVCGKGNNGGDGFVAARKLHDAGKRVTVLLLAGVEDVKGDAAAMLQRMPVEPVTVRGEADLNGSEAVQCFESDLLLDGILGTGVKPPVEGLYAAAMERINRSQTAVVAVDIPSGANADAFVPEDYLRCRADAVVTFTAPRPAHIFGDLTRGEIVVVPIGSPPEAIQSDLNLDVISWPDIASCFALRKPDANKGNFGHVLVVGGAIGKSGAAAMAGMGALRVGAGLCTVATPKSVLPLVAGFAPELMTEPLAETETGTISAGDYGRVATAMQGKAVVALGPGISRNPETVQLIHSSVAKCAAPLVLDADGLNAFEGRAQLLNGGKRPLVITPHPGEMSRLTGLSIADIQKDRIGVARKFSAEHQCIVVLKGHRTLIAEPNGHVWVNTTGNPGMATGGTGDVLTGFIAGMMAQFPNDLVRATCAAVWLHGYAGDIAAFYESERAVIATSLVRHGYIDHVTKDYLDSQKSLPIHGVGEWLHDR
jgi:ADP-dependent NAD(P)H-hydrate dehydratase / NAD(P)H-hydrate epimerase